MDFIGALVKKIDELGFRENTMILFSSDNGPEVPTVNNMRKTHNHDEAGLRGVKRDQWEGGYRAPFIARWPKKIEAGGTSNQTICLTDIMATCATLRREAAGQRRRG